MNNIDLIRRIQAAFPRIYVQCHGDHARDGADGLSPRDATILAHLDRAQAITQSTLARHLGITKSTMSEAIKHLAARGYVRQVTAPDRRAQLLSLTEEGLQAMGAASVLETGRLADLLSRLDGAQARRAVAGLELLATAALAMTHDDEEECK